MRLLFCGDIVGRAGRDVVVERLPGLKRDHAIDFVVANGENAAGGFGITRKISDDLFAAGVDCITTGNHVFDQRDLIGHIDQDPRLLRPLNMLPGTPGRGSVELRLADGRKVLVVQVIGRLFMGAFGDPFGALESELMKHPLGAAVDAIVVDVHAEATSEKTALGHLADGRASLVVGSHTHVPTADHQILPGGTAYITDVGMTGDYDSVIGMGKEVALQRFRSHVPGPRLTPALGESTLCAVFVETGPDGLAQRIAPLRLGGRLSRALPDG